MRSLLAVVGVLAASPAAAQAPDPVAGYVIDLRGATSGLPKETAFYPGLPVDTIVPARGFGFDVGAHVYLFSLGVSQVGLGANYLRARGTTPGIVARVGTVSPQVSFNFGTASGWSYLSAGLGRAWVTTRVERASGTLTADSGGLRAVNYGGGARWFLADRLAVGFDLRVHHVSGPPKIRLFATSVGFSVR
ncbi:MAG: hypothetical protein ACRD26_21420 [Vicinamibacterales bacterium]